MKPFFVTLYQYWLAFGHAIGVVVTPVQLLIVYTGVFGPARLFSLVARKDLLDRNPADQPSHWKLYPERSCSIEDARHQF